MRYTLITQIALISVSLVIIFSFVKPMFAEIKTTQDELFLYKDAVDKASQYNTELQSLISIRDSFSQQDKQALEVFIPTQIDALKVMRDIESIFALSKKPLLSLTPNEPVLPKSSEEELVDVDVEQVELPEQAGPIDTTMYQDFDITFEGTYVELKDILKMIEANETLLEVMELSFATAATEVPADGAASAPAQEEGTYSFSLSVRTFAVDNISS